MDTLPIVLGSVAVFLVGYELGKRHGADMAATIIYHVVNALSGDEDADSDK